ncbi:MAG TPA: hypothetical protein VEF35_04160 [Candidatus Bathyarchaeia archaeon]|nr:hypothetical protein [Candidatus Bathyarchaeia archaeon]
MDAKEKESGLPTPSARIKFETGCVLIMTFIISLPATILFMVMGWFMVVGLTSLRARESSLTRALIFRQMKNERTV